MKIIKEIHVPDIGDFSNVEIIEVLVAPGDEVAQEGSLITLESDKASIEIPSPQAGVVRELKVGLGDKVSEGNVILLLDVSSEEHKADESSTHIDVSVENRTPEHAAAGESATVKLPSIEKDSVPTQQAGLKQNAVPQTPKAGSSTSRKPHKARIMRPSPTAHIVGERTKKAHASPSVRRFARELGADLGEIKGRGPKGRILKSDIQEFVKRALVSGGAGLKVADMPEVDFAKFGEIEIQPLTRINKLSGVNLHRNWVRVPHVTQFDEADITELEDFRKSLNREYGEKGVKITILSFLVKAVVSALKQYPRFNTSLDVSQENLIFRHYYHIGVAVDTADGLVVPVIRDVDRKSLVEVASELGELSTRARQGKLSPAEMQGGCFSISSLGGIGGTAFTPIVNMPEVAVLGVSRAGMKPVYDKEGFVPRLILPLSLSYDHRVIDGANGARFTQFISAMLSDTRRMLL
jgi:pyruvate dehydrogenase E2 component (dihydrolipoamide acetyltransferase)